MKAIQLVEAKQPVELREIPTPDLGPGDVLVRVKAAGICHSDAHYRSGRSRVDPLPLTLGHEVAGVVEKIGRDVITVADGDRVCLHYLTSCGQCSQCERGNEQFCSTGLMLGHFRRGGWAEFIVVPARNAVRLPDGISFEHGAVMMCSSSTALHALGKGRLAKGETVAVFGAGGLGMSAIQLARALGASTVFAVDVSESKLALAKEYGAVAVDARSGDAAEIIREMTDGNGVDVAVELIGLGVTMRQALQSVAVHGRAVIAGLSSESLEIDTYRELLGREAELIGANDHLLSELPFLLQLAADGTLDLSRVVQRTVPLDASIVNEVLDDLDAFRAPVRTVIVV